MADTVAKDLVKGETSHSQGVLPKKKIAGKPENSQEGVHKASPKNGIPPKHTVAATERKPNLTPPTSSKSTVSSASRNAANGSVSRSSLRASTNVDGRRSQAATTGSGPSNGVRKARTSISSPDSSTRHRAHSSDGEDEDAENKPPSSSERAGSTSPLKPGYKASSNRFSQPASSTTSRKPQSTLAHASKTGSLRGVEEARVQHRQSAAHSGRVGPSPTQAQPMSNRTITKRSSINSASTQPKTANLKPANQEIDHSKPSSTMVRPGLGNRKSTMSVTIEQRLREMSLVHEMLRAAMIEDGDEKDEVKEEYGKQMDETLAALKTKLEEAKSKEGLLGVRDDSAIDSTANQGPYPSLDTDEEVATPLGESRNEAELLKAAMQGENTTYSRERENALLEELEGVDVSSAEAINDDELRLTKLELLKACSDYEGFQISIHQEINGLNETIDSLTNGLHNLQAAHQSAEHEVDRLERLNQELQTQFQEHIIESEYEYRQNYDTIEELRKSESQLLEARQREVEASREADCLMEDRLHELQISKQHVEDDALQIQKSLQERILEIQESRKREFSRCDTAVEEFESRLREHKDAEIKLVEEHNQAVAALRRELDETRAKKDRESKHQQEVIESLQGGIRDLNETKERELETVKHTLAKEHEEVVGRLRMELENPRAKKEEDVRQDGDSKEPFESPDELLRRTYQSQLDQIRATLASVHASNIELRNSVDDTGERHGEEASMSRTELERVESENSKLRAELEITRQQFSDLDKKRDATQFSLQSTEDALKQMSENVASLQRQLTLLTEEEIVILEKNAHAEKELAATREENQQLSATAQCELEKSRGLRAELEYHAFRTQEEYDSLEAECDLLKLHLESLETQTAGPRSGCDEATYRELAALRADIEAATKTEVRLTSELYENKEKYQMHLREVESALRVTTAELAELHNSRPFRRLQPSMGRWMDAESTESDGGSVGEDSSSHIEGQV